MEEKDKKKHYLSLICTLKTVRQKEVIGTSRRGDKEKIPEE